MFVTRGEMAIWVQESGKVLMWPLRDVPPDKRVAISVEPNGTCSLSVLNFMRMVADQEAISISAFPSVALQKIGDTETDGISGTSNSGQRNEWRLKR